jgi:hypothetical protein
MRMLLLCSALKGAHCQQQGKLQEMQASNAQQLEELAANIKVDGRFLLFIPCC